jgi:hypothetical protein
VLRRWAVERMLIIRGQNEFFAEHLQPTIMPTLLAQGAVRPNRYRIVEGKTLLERAQRALNALRRKEPHGERLVWRVAEETEESK